jgi:xanthine/uracil permease
MLAGVITPPILLSGAAGANLGTAGQEYLVSTSLIVCGILSLIQITRFKILGTRYFHHLPANINTVITNAKIMDRYYVGTGLISV